MNNGRFAISIHILTLLCKSPGELLSSDYIAGSININPVLVRKEIAELKKAGYIESKEGKNGGCMLSKSPEHINFAEVLKLVSPNSILSYAKNVPNPNCKVGKEIKQHLNTLYTEAENAMFNNLSNINLKQFCNQFK